MIGSVDAEGIRGESVAVESVAIVAVTGVGVAGAGHGSGTKKHDADERENIRRRFFVQRTRFYTRGGICMRVVCEHCTGNTMRVFLL